MTLIRWTPIRDLATEIFDLQREINRMFDRFFRGFEEEEELKVMKWSPRVDISETDDEYIVRADVPGVSKDDIKITIKDNVLTISGEKKQEKETKNENFHRIERVYGSFTRTFTLPGAVKVDKVEARFKDGVLTIKLPKVEEAKAKEIEVKVD
ncbi:HSP20 family protein [Candidatus Kryptobacter tengchongensis]|uniref:HSP20 family protein n=1 Tax=Kryptobacter tengchongensis TaxID=1643429 RepID=A0A656D623_KRYT1|nr:Hsp20/alpha crystallin family protein [Candidatus Kryptobacter tengchongensis]CUS99313.1 HSP20 family protein [Candidatus Kryptobacter tengchongensis]CUU06232.1 HSP20 family protein [Candidatus Kryptobacter tengchongensis]